MRSQCLIRCALSGLVLVSLSGESWARGWCRVRCCRPVTCCVVYSPVCGYMPSYPYGGRVVVGPAVPPPAPPRGPSGVPGERDTELLRDGAAADPPPVPPESTGTPAPAPQPTLSPRDIQPTQPGEPQTPSTPDDPATADDGEDLGQILGARSTEPGDATEPAE